MSESISCWHNSIFQTSVQFIFGLLQFGQYQAPTNQTPALLLQGQTITSLADLQPFFTRLLHQNELSASTEMMISEAESVIDNDLIEPAD